MTVLLQALMFKHPGLYQRGSTKTIRLPDGVYDAFEYGAPPHGGNLLLGLTASARFLQD